MTRHLLFGGIITSVFRKKSQGLAWLFLYVNHLIPYFAMMLANSVLLAKPFITLSLDVPVLSLFIQSLYPP